jgi:hypothetical protein
MSGQLPEGCFESKPINHHDFKAPGKGVKQDCVKCQKPKEEHTIYERVQILGQHGSRFAWRVKESK